MDPEHLKVAARSGKNHSGVTTLQIRDKNGQHEVIVIVLPYAALPECLGEGVPNAVDAGGLSLQPPPPLHLADRRRHFSLNVHKMS